MWYLIVCVFCVSSFHLIIIKYSRIYIIVFENKYFVLIITYSETCLYRSQDDKNSTISYTLYGGQSHLW